jgi:hypothetical protein
MIVVIQTSVMMVVVEVLVLLWVPHLLSLSSSLPWFSLLSFSEEGNGLMFHSKRLHGKRRVFLCFEITGAKRTTLTQKVLFGTGLAYNFSRHILPLWV